MNRFQDDWGPTLGQEEKEQANSEKKKIPKKDSLSALVYEFRDRLLLDTSNFFNSQVNAAALTKAFRKLLDAGKSHDDIRNMIIQFNKDIAAKPLKNGLPAWKAFIARLDELVIKIDGHDKEFSYDGPKIDPRLTKENHD